MLIAIDTDTPVVRWCVYCHAFMIVQSLHCVKVFPNHFLENIPPLPTLTTRRLVAATANRKNAKVTVRRALTAPDQRCRDN